MSTLPCGRSLTLSNFDRNAGEGGDLCDLSSLVFVDAFGLVATACSLLARDYAAQSTTLRWPKAAATRSHLSAMGFMAFAAELGYGPVPDDVKVIDDRPDVVVPLTLVRDIGAAEKLSHLLWAQVRDQVDPAVLEALGEGFWELVANALEHSGDKAEAVLMGQVYSHGSSPDHDRRVQVVIGDAGLGIRSSLASSGLHRPTDDHEAIRLATEYLVSSVDDPGRGQGLSSTIEQVTALEGRLVIRTGSARQAITASEQNRESVPFLPGTIVAMSLPLYPGER